MVGGGGWRGGIIPFLNNPKDLGGQGIVLEGKELHPITTKKYHTASEKQSGLSLNCVFRM